MTDPDAPLARHARITWAHTIKPEPVTWAWSEGGADRIPAGALAVAAGREGTGKSSFGVWLTAQITRGSLPGSFYGAPRPVLYVAVEDSWKHTLVPRLIAAGADLSMVGRFEVVNEIGQDATLSLPHDNDMFRAAIVEHGVALVVIDPLMSVIGAGIDTHRERDTRTALDPLAKIADRTGSVILGIAHFSKAAGSDAASLITGSGAFKNVPRAVFGFARDESDENGGRVMTQVKNSLGRDCLPSLSYRIDTATIDTDKGPAMTGKFVLTGESERTVADVLRDARSDGYESSDHKDASSWLVDFITTNGPTAAPEVFKAGAEQGFSKDALKRAKGKRIKSEKNGMGGGWAWVLAGSTDDEDPEGSTKGAKSAGISSPLPSLPSVLPSRPEVHHLVQSNPIAAALATAGSFCARCLEPLSHERAAAGFTVCPACRRQEALGA